MLINGIKLKAAALCAAKKDVRYYLNGVYVARNEKEPEFVYIVATSGHYLFCGRLSAEECEADTFFEIIIPNETLQKLKISRASPFVELAVDSALGIYRLDDINFKPIDRFPDYIRVIPAEISGVAASHNAAYMALCEKALQQWGSSKEWGRMFHNGDGAGLFVLPSIVEEAYCLIMPFRSDVSPPKVFTPTFAPGEKAS